MASAVEQAETGIRLVEELVGTVQQLVTMLSKPSSEGFVPSRIEALCADCNAKLVRLYSIVDDVNLALVRLCKLAATRQPSTTLELTAKHSARASRRLTSRCTSSRSLMRSCSKRQAPRTRCWSSASTRCASCSRYSPRSTAPSNSCCLRRRVQRPSHTPSPSYPCRSRPRCQSRQQSHNHRVPLRRPTAALPRELVQSSSTCPQPDHSGAASTLYPVVFYTFELTEVKL